MAFITATIDVVADLKLRRKHLNVNARLQLSESAFIPRALVAAAPLSANEAWLHRFCRRYT